MARPKKTAAAQFTRHLKADKFAPNKSPSSKVVKTAVGVVLPKPDDDMVRYIWVYMPPLVVEKKLASYTSLASAYALIDGGDLKKIADDPDDNESAATNTGGIAAPTRGVKERFKQDAIMYGATAVFLADKTSPKSKAVTWEEI